MSPRTKYHPPMARLRRATCALAAGIVLHAAGAAALPAQSLPPSDALRLGDVFDALRASSPRVAAANAQARAAQARVPGAGKPPDPELQLGWMNYSLPQLAPMEPTGMAQLQVMQMLPLGGKLGLAKGIAAAQASAESHRAEETWWEQRAQAAMAFHDLYQLDARLVVMRETARLLDDMRRTAESMYRVGEGRQADVLRAQVEVARMAEDTLRMHAMRLGMLARLNALLDRPHDAHVGPAVLPAFPLGLPPLDSLQRMAVQRRPMLRAADDEMAAAEQMQRMVRKELVPDLTVGVQYGVRGATMSGTDAGGMPMTERRTEHMGSLMIGATLPIFARSRQLQQRQEAEAMRQMAAADRAGMRAETRGQLGAAYAELERARRLAALYRTTILPQAQAAVASSQSAYRVGQVDFMTLLDNQMTANKYRQELAVLEAEEGKAWAELEMLTGSELLDPHTTTVTAASPAAGEDR